MSATALLAPRRRSTKSSSSRGSSAPRLVHGRKRGGRREAAAGAQLHDQTFARGWKLSRESGDRRLVRDQNDRTPVTWQGVEKFAQVLDACVLRFRLPVE